MGNPVRMRKAKSKGVVYRQITDETRAKMSAAQRNRFRRERLDRQYAQDPVISSKIKPGHYKTKIENVKQRKDGTISMTLVHPILGRSESAKAPTAKETKARRFVLDRAFDGTGTSGTGIVAEGIQFSNGQVVIHWLSQLEAINVYANAVVLEQLHGHGGNTTIKWLDP